MYKKHKKKVKRNNNIDICSPSCIYFHQCVEPSNIQYNFVNGCKHATNFQCYCLYHDKIITSWDRCKNKKKYSDIKTNTFKDELKKQCLEEHNVK